MTLFEVYKKSLTQLKNPDTEEINIRILLCEINGLKTMSDFYLRKDEEIRDLPRFNEYFERFLNSEPVQYILHKTQFLGLDFYVDNRVLIPRQESEEVVDFALKKIKEKFGNNSIDVADVCCGSGVMGLTIAKKINVNRLYLSDISKDAIDVAKKNATDLNVNAETFVANSLDGLIKNNLKVDVLISNPPYILENEPVDESVLNNEPHLALFADKDFSVYKSIISNLKNINKNNLLVVFEIGLNTRKVVEKYINDYYPEAEYQFIKDMNGKERIVYIFLK